MKSIAVGACAVILTTAVQAQQPTPPAAQAPTAACLTQYTEVIGHSAASMIASGHEIKASVQGGLWLQKGKEVFYCNSGRLTEGEAMCWRLREPGRC